MLLPLEPKDACVAVACSAGGLEHLETLVRALPDNFPAAVILLQHSAVSNESYLAEILGRACKLPVSAATEGQRVRNGYVYVASAGEHVTVKDRTIRLLGSVRLRFVRPSADLLFQSVAAEYGLNAIAVVLSGSGTDGAEGVQAIKAAGGLVLTTDERTSEHFGMPETAIRTGCVDLTFPIETLVDALVAMVERPELRVWFSIPAEEAKRHLPAGTSLLAPAGFLRELP